MELEQDGDSMELEQLAAPVEARRRRFRGLGLWRRRARKRERQLELQMYELHKDVRAPTRALHKERQGRAKLIGLLGEAKVHITALREEVRRLRSENELEEEA